jgi:hypothetical protein
VKKDVDSCGCENLPHPLLHGMSQANGDISIIMLDKTNGMTRKFGWLGSALIIFKRLLDVMQNIPLL